VEMASCAWMLGTGPGAAFSPLGSLIVVIGGGAAMVSSHRMLFGGSLIHCTSAWHCCGGLCSGQGYCISSGGWYPSSRSPKSPPSFIGFSQKWLFVVWLNVCFVAG
jgi:hypothetical protein